MGCNLTAKSVKNGSQSEAGWAGGLACIWHNPYISQLSQRVAHQWREVRLNSTYPNHSCNPFTCSCSWLEGKHSDDAAEGLWRIKDKLYDLTDFARRHPGGAFWIERTKGTDITEPFESHHIEEHAQRMLSKFEVRSAAQPRNYRFTLEEKGFYLTLKRRVREKLRQLNYRPSHKTDVSSSLKYFCLWALARWLMMIILYTYIR